MCIRDRIYFVNPFTRLALGFASLARPVASPSVAPPNAADGAWCLQGSFPTGDALPQLQDDGVQGDLVADDRVYSLEYAIARPGNYRWQVVGCDEPTRTFPAAMAWLTTSEPNQLVTFIFDSTEPVSYTHLRAHETVLDLVCRLLLEKKNELIRVMPFDRMNIDQQISPRQARVSTRYGLNKRQTVIRREWMSNQPWY